MLGGGIYITQNKVLPGSYINFVNLAKTTNALGERGTVAIALPLGKAPGTVITVTASDFALNAKNLLGFEPSANEMTALREIFCNAKKVHVYDLGLNDAKSPSDACAAFEAYDFNVICAYTEDSSEVAIYEAMVKTWRDELGKKCQLVAYNKAGNHEGIINVVSNVSDEGAPEHALVAWVAGAEAACKVNASCTNMLYNGEYTIVTNKTQTELEACITAGQIVFHLVYGEIRMLEDVNSLTETTADKGEDFKSNQTIRVLDQIANDIAKMFNTRYLGKVANNNTGRLGFWGDIVAYHRELERIEAIESYDPALLTVEQGATKKSIVVNNAVTVTNCMAQLYMTVVVQ